MQISICDVYIYIYIYMKVCINTGRWMRWVGMTFVLCLTSEKGHKEKKTRKFLRGGENAYTKRKDDKRKRCGKEGHNGWNSSRQKNKVKEKNIKEESSKKRR